MIVVRYAVCSERDRKPVTRAVTETREQAAKIMESCKRADAHQPQMLYWIAELGPECDAWRWLGRDDTVLESG